MNSKANTQSPKTNGISFDDSILQVLDVTGRQVGELPALQDEQLLGLFRSMVYTRAFDENSMRMLVEMGVDGLITDYPGLGVEVLAEILKGQ